MKKIIQSLAMVGLITLTPALAFAHGNENKGHEFKEQKKLIKIEDRFEDKIDMRLGSHKEGSVTAVSSSGFMLTDKGGVVYAVNTSTSTIITSAFGGTITLAQISVGQNANVKGPISGNTITATTVVITPANTHRAEGGGTVTAVNGSSFTVQQQNHGIVSSFTVNTNASTTVTSASSSTSTVASITVGSKVKVKGFWNEVLNVLNAIRIHIK